MNPVVQAAAVYEREPCARSFEADLEAHLLTGWVVSTPGFFVMARPVVHDAPPALVLDPWHDFGGEADCWHVWLAAGDLGLICAAVPYFLPWVSFERDNRLRSYRFEPLRRKLWPTHK